MVAFTRHSLQYSILLAGALCFLLACKEDNPVGGIEPGPSGPPSVDEFSAWSPDGRTIAYRHLHVTFYDPVTGAYNVNQDSTGIWFVSPDGSNPRMFLHGGDAPDWSPDSQWLAFVSGAQIYKIKVNGDSLTQLTFEGRNFFPHWSPDGKKIAYDSNYLDARGANVIWIMDSTGKNKNDISSHGVGEWRMPDWSPTGERVVYSRYVTGVLGEEIYVMSSSGQSSNRLTQNNVTDRNPSWSPSGTQIAFSSNVNIWVMNPDGSNFQQLTKESGAMPNWSPDGNQIVYSFTHLWIMNANGSNKRQLTFSPQVPQLP